MEITMPYTRIPTTRLRVVLCAVLALATSACATQTGYVTSEKAGVGVIDLNRMELTRTFPVGADGPRGLSLTADGAELLVANKNTGDVSALDTKTGAVLRRVAIGKNPEFVRISGGFAYVTYEPGESGKPPAAGKPAHGDDNDANEPPAEIAMIDLKSFTVVRSIKSGHETEGVEFSRNKNEMLVTNEGDDTVSVYDARTGTPLRTVKLAAGGRPRGIKLSPDGSRYVVTLESASKFVVLDAGDFQVIKTVDTKLGPYGVAFDPSGERLFVAAARSNTIQVFDATTYAHLRDVPVGQRCWHFSFTPDGSKLMAACGRSNAVYVIDAKSGELIKQIAGLPLAWGIVTYPNSAGSID
jgi:YVTN family beta-propeller protein